MTRIGNILLVLGIAIFVGALAYGLSARQPKQYESVARLFVSKGAPPELQALGPAFAEADVKESIKVSTIVIELNSLDVAEATAKANPILKMNAGQVASSVDASPVPETLVIELTARAPNGFVAAVLARAYINSYIHLRHQRQAARARSVLRSVRTRFAGLSRADQIGPAGGLLRDQISVLETLVRVGTADPQVIEEPRPSAVAAVPKPGRNALFGVLFGLAVGAGLVALRSGRRGRSSPAPAGPENVAVARGRPRDHVH